MSDQLLKEIIESQQLIIKTLKKHSTLFDEVQKNQISLENKVDKLELRIETESAEKIGSLYDFRKVQTDVNERILAALNRIEAKIEIHDIEISILDKTNSNKRKAK